MLKIYFDGILIPEDNYISLKNDFILFEDVFCLGSVSANTFTLEIPANSISNVSLSANTNINIKLDDKDYANVIIDKFEIKDKNIIALTLTDKMTLFNFNYDASLIVPCTVKDILENICEIANIELGTTIFVNSDIIVDFYDNRLTAREYLSYISEVAGCYAQINQDGKLYLKSFLNQIENKIDIDTCESFKLGEHHIIDRVVFDNGLLKYETSEEDESKETLYLNADNLYINDEITFSNIANQILNFDYYCFQTGKCQILSNIIAGDKLVFNDGTDNYNTIAQYSINFVGCWIGGYSLNLNSKNQNETQQIGLNTQVKNLSVNLNRIDNSLSITVEQLDNTNKEVSSLIQTTTSIQQQVTKVTNDLSVTEENLQEQIIENHTLIEQTAENISNSIQRSGGANLLYNSVMLAYDNNKTPKNWTVSGTGTLDIQSNAEALANGLSGNIFILNNKTVKQRIYVKPDSTTILQEQKTYYTFSCRVKKELTGDCYIKIYNANESYIISLASGESSFYGEYEIKALLPKMNYYDVEFYGSVNSNATFTDVMFASGDYKTNWQQANGEIMNTQVNINIDGVLVKSSIYIGDYTIMSPLEFAGYSIINGVLTKVFSLNKDTTEVTKIKVKDEVTMPPIKVVPITTGTVTGWAFVPSS